MSYSTAFNIQAHTSQKQKRLLIALRSAPTPATSNHRHPAVYPRNVSVWSCGRRGAIVRSHRDRSIDRSTKHTQCPVDTPTQEIAFYDHRITSHPQTNQPRRSLPPLAGLTFVASIWLSSLNDNPPRTKPLNAQNPAGWGGRGGEDEEEEMNRGMQENIWCKIVRYHGNKPKRT